MNYVSLILFFILVLILIPLSCKTRVEKFTNGVAPKYPNENETLTAIHNKLKVTSGCDMRTELPEQIMEVRHLTPNDIVLELGGNIGRNSLIISSILTNPSRQHLVVETIPKDANTLREHAKLNNLNFQVLEGAISKNNLIQNSWKTEIAPEDGSVPSDYFKVKTFLWNDVVSKYNMKFNTIVADCEGCLVDMLREFPEILRNVKKIIIEHDFVSEEDYSQFKKILGQNNFKMIDSLLKTDPYCPGQDWKNQYFISVWKRLEFETPPRNLFGFQSPCWWPT